MEVRTIGGRRFPVTAVLVAVALAIAVTVLAIQARSLSSTARSVTQTVGTTVARLWNASEVGPWGMRAGGHTVRAGDFARQANVGAEVRDAIRDGDRPSLRAIAARKGS